MDDFDILYMMKTPFYLGDYDKSLTESQSIEINSDDQRNESLKNLFIVRALTAKGDFVGLRTFMTQLN